MTAASPPKTTTAHKDWTQGSILGNLLRLSWPMVLMESCYVLSQIVDMVWIGKLGAAAIAGVGIANLVLMLVLAMDFGLVMGVRAMIARHVGAGDIQSANRVAAQGLLMGTGWGMIVMTVGLVASGPLMALFGVESEVLIDGMAYLRVMFAGWVPLVLLVMGLYAFQASGDTLTPLKIEILIRAVHITMCPFLVLGWWGTPRLGVSGAALSNVIAHCLGVFTVMTLLFRGKSRLHLKWKDFRPDPSIIWRILNIGVPALVMNLQRSLGNLILTWLVVPFGTLAVAAHSLTARVEMFLYMPGIGFGLGAGVLVGQNLGAGRPERAEQSAWRATAILEAVMLVCSAAILIWAEPLMTLFTADAELVTLGGEFLRIAVVGYAVIAFVSVLQSCITGAGDTLPNMVISLVLIWLVELPLAYLLSRHTALAVYGLRWSITIYTVVGAVAYTLYFKSGRWKHKKV